MEWVGLAFDATGVLVIAGGAVVATGRLAASASTAKAMDVRRFRQDFGGAIVLGLEFLVAGDIIRTEPSHRRWKMSPFWRSSS